MPQDASKRARRPGPDPLAAEAAEWIVRLSAGDPGERERARVAFEAWQRQSPRHAEAAIGMQNVIGRVDGLRAAAGDRPEPVRAALEAARSSGRRGRAGKVIACAAVACAVGLGAWLALPERPLAWATADLHAGAGQWLTRTLPDGSRVTLASGSAVDLHFDARRRTLELAGGEILVEVAHDAARPFVVETAEGSIRALGTRFVVDRHDGVTTLTMLQSRVVVQSAAPRPGDAQTAIVAGGQRVAMTAAGLGPVEPVDARSVADAWRYHQLVVDNRPLAEVLDELARYRGGRIVYRRARLDGVDVAAVLPLDDTDRALQLLADSLPGLRVYRMTPWLVVVDMDAPAAGRAPR